MPEPEYAIRWLRRPKRKLRHYSCDKCAATADQYVSPDLGSVWHLCRYKTPSGTVKKVWRALTCDS